MKRFTTIGNLIFFFCFSLLLNINNAKAQYGLSFNGTNQYVSFGSAAGLGSSSFTLECWFYKSGTGIGTSTGSGGIASGIPLIAKGRAEADGSNLDMNYFLGINLTNNVLCADFEEGTGQPSPGLNHPVYGVTPLCNNVWYHAAVTFDGVSWNLYLNGNLEATLVVNRLPQSASIQHASIATTLNSTGVASGYFNGKMDEVRIWNYARTQTDIQNNISLQITSTSGLIGRYGLNENTGTVTVNTGSAGTAVNGNLINTPTWIAGTTFTALSNNSSLQFGGTNSYVTFGNNTALGLPQFTIECWFRKEGTGVNATTGTGGVSAKPLITKGRKEADGSTVDLNYFLGIKSSSNVLCADFEEGTGQPSPGTNHPISGVTVIQNNVWYHAAATYDGATWKLYLNGNLEATVVVNRSPQSASIQHAAIGSALNSLGTASGYFFGRIDEARIWNSAKTQTEIQSNINNQITSSQPGLVARWGMNDNCGTTVTGIGATTINGTVTGSNWNWNSGAPLNISATCTVASGLSTSSVTSSSAILNWGAVTGAVSFNIQYREVGAVTWINISSNTNAVSVSSLKSSTQYEFQVQTVCSSGALAYSSPVTFSTLASSAVLVRSAYLNSVSPTGIVIRWRTDIATDSKVSFGTTFGNYTSTITNPTVTTEHIVQLSSLFPATKYYYRIGNSNTVLQGDVENYFSTAPVAGTVTPLRIWALGDFGAGTTIESAVRDAYLNYTGSTYTNLFIWLGDNAYEYGTDANFQANVFGYFGTQFKHFPVMPAPGNHEYNNVGYQSVTALTTNWPYFDNFNMPTAAEAGGVASGTEKYYSYNYANIHFITLDSYGAMNNSGSPMYTWLQNDLSANTQRWTIVYYHHAPYTKGSHDSDTEQELINMRQNINPLLEQYHVDLVLNGHSHVNERSYLIKGHYGLANTFTTAMKVSTATNTFAKSPPYDGTIYAVCGTGGKATGTTKPGWPMPCMYFSNATNNCSIVIDVNGDNLSLKYIATDGSIPDQFTITKTGATKLAGGNAEDNFKFSIVPNPTSDVFTISYQLAEEANISLKLMDVTGRVIEGSEHNFFQYAGGYDFLFNNFQLNLADGMYLVVLTVNGKVEVKKVLITQ